MSTADDDGLFDFDSALPAEVLAQDAPADFTTGDLEAVADAVAEGTEGQLPEDHPVLRWYVQDDAQAAWAMGKLTEALAELRRVEAQMARYQGTLDRWFANATRRASGTVAFMESRLVSYAKARRRENPKVATLPLPTGKVTTTQQTKPTLEVTDLAALTAWTLANAPEALEPVPATWKLPKANLTRLGVPDLEAGVLVHGEGDDREVVPGVQVLPPRLDAKVVPDAG